MRGWDGPGGRGISVRPVWVRDVLLRTDWLRERLAGDGRIGLRPLDAYPPERVGEAQMRVDAGGVCGRLLIEF